LTQEDFDDALRIFNSLWPTGTVAEDYFGTVCQGRELLALSRYAGLEDPPELLKLCEKEGLPLFEVHTKLM
jgi:hypothetical protein